MHSRFISNVKMWSLSIQGKSWRKWLTFQTLSISLGNTNLFLLFFSTHFLPLFLINAHQKRGEFADTVSKQTVQLGVVPQSNTILSFCLSVFSSLTHTHTQSKRFLQFAHWLIHSEEVWYSVCTFVDVIAMAWPACHLMSLLMCNNTKKTIKLRVELHILQLPLNFTVSCFKGKLISCPLT